MKLKALSLAVLLGISALASAAPVRLIIQGNPGLPDSELDSIIAVHGKRHHSIGKTGMSVIEVNGNGKEIAKLLRKHKDIKFAEEDKLVKPTLWPSDPEFYNQWHLQKINAPQAWDSATGTGVIIAVLDSGIDMNHPDLVPQLVPGYNFYDNNTDTTDVQGHGTATAGTAAAAGNNGLGVSSVAFGAKIMPIRIADTNGYAYWSTIAQGIYWAADHGARVANVSYGAGDSSAVQQASQYMKNKGGLVTVSAGNNGIDEGFVPSTSFITVSATDGNDNKASWSSYGSFVSLSAPGTNIETTSRGGYGWWNGTSFSAPIVAGVIADMMAANPQLNSSQIEDILFKTATDLGAPGRDPIYGYGRVNAQAAVEAARNTVVTVDTTPPTSTIAYPYGNTVVSGIVNIQANVSDDSGYVAKVELMVNSQVVATDTTLPFAFSWDSRSVANGWVNVWVRAYDAAGNNTLSETTWYNVSNAVNVKKGGKGNSK